MNAEEKNRYFQELTLNLQHEGFAVKPETEEGLLPIELDGQRLCLALDTGSVRYWREDTADDHRSAALDKAISITKTTAEYMRQMETAPRLTASGLTGDYRLLADFNDVVLAGHPTRYGVQFATWERVRERAGLNAGNFYGPPGGVDSYTAAKRDFATRSGLIPHVVLFTPEQLTEVYRSIHETLEAVLSNPRRPECDQITVPFPIPVDQYDKTIEMLQAIDLGFSANRDCTVDEVNSRYNVLNTLVGTLVNIDQLDYLAKRLDGFCAGEVSQFQAMAHKLGLSEIKDFINLTYCCQQTTVITDFSDLEQIGKDHTMTLNGGAMPIDQYQAVNGKEAALQLINGGRGVITPYGVAYDNGMELEPVYNGHQFPSYLYDHSLLVLEITPKRGLVEGSNPEYLYLPASEHQIERTLLRVGVTTLHDAKMRIDWDELPEKVVNALELDHLSGSDLPALNRMCQSIEPLKEADMEKLNAVVLFAEAGDMMAVRQLAENLDLFDFVPGLQTPEEYGRHMIRESGHFDYDENLEGFYDYRRYGEQQLRQEGGQFNECGYVVYQGTMLLEELMMEDPAEKHQREQGLQMGGLTQ
ncbi:hypothetical protein N510_003481 [Firmicutes bacterium ASF500]|nr:hypothetical protein N510_003481 [Firmicutes bacterium ASF500]